MTDRYDEPVKRLSKKSCFKCNERDDVLVCSYVGCPIVLHKRCMLCAAHFDDRGNFYCPYCAYKRALDECHKAKEVTILAKKTLVSFLDAKVVRSTEDLQTVKSSKGERAGGSGEIHGGRVGIVMPVNLDSENLKTKRQKTVISLEGNCNRGVQRKETQREPHGRSVCSTGNEMMEDDHGSDKITSATLHDECISSKQLKENSKNGNQFAEIQKDQSDGAESLVRSSKNATCQTTKRDTSMTTKEFGIFSGEHQANKDTEEVYYEEMEEKEKPEVEGSTNLTRHDGLSVTTKTSIKGDVNEFRVTVSSENLVTKNQQNKDAVDGNDGGLAKKVHKQTERQEPTKQNLEVTNKEAEVVNFSILEHEDFSRSHMATTNKNNTGQTSVIGDFHCKRKDERGEQLKLHKDDVISTSKENRGVSYEELDTGYESKSTQESHHLGYGLRSKRKSRNSGHSEFDNQPTEPRTSSSSSESEFEEYEEAACVKSRKKVDSLKQKQHTPISIGRRKKLPWTKEEEETLKEGVAKYSLTAKKNLPWMKILEFGSHIFDGTRTPDDLKDKWRRILSKAHENA